MAVKPAGYRIEERLQDAFRKYCRGRRHTIQDIVGAAMLGFLEASPEQRDEMIVRYTEWLDGGSASNPGEKLWCSFLPDGTILACNDRYARLCADAEPEDMIGRKWTELLGDGRRQMALSQYLKMTPDHPVVESEAEFRRDDGTRGRILWRGRGFFTSSGQLVKIDAEALPEGVTIRLPDDVELLAPEQTSQDGDGQLERR